MTFSYFPGNTLRETQNPLTKFRKRVLCVFLYIDYLSHRTLQDIIITRHYQGRRKIFALSYITWNADNFLFGKAAFKFAKRRVPVVRKQANLKTTQPNIKLARYRYNDLHFQPSCILRRIRWNGFTAASAFHLADNG